MSSSSRHRQNVSRQRARLLQPTSLAREVLNLDRVLSRRQRLGALSYDVCLCCGGLVFFGVVGVKVVLPLALSGFALTMLFSALLCGLGLKIIVAVLRRPKQNPE